MLGQLTNDQMHNILSSQTIGKLACTDGKMPYIVPVTYAFDGEFIYGQSNDGAKLKILRKNPNVCFHVCIISSMSNWQSVNVFGKFQELKNEEADRAREILFGSVFYLMTGNAIHPHEHQVTATLDDNNRVKGIMYRIKIDQMTGRFEKQ